MESRYAGKNNANQTSLVFRQRTSICSAMGRILQLTNDLNGSGMVKIIRQELARLRDSGNRVTGGGFRQMVKRVALKLLRTGSAKPDHKPPRVDEDPPY